MEAFSKNGIVFGGQDYAVDALVLATGFVLSRKMDPSEKSGAVIKGTNGEKMPHRFEMMENPPVFGLAMSNFPNCFGYFRTAPASYNLTSVYNMLAKCIATVVSKAHMVEARNMALASRGLLSLCTSTMP